MDGEAPECQGYPVLLVEGDAQSNEKQATPGLNVFTFAVQVLAQPSSGTPLAEELRELLAETNRNQRRGRLPHRAGAPGTRRAASRGQ